MCLVHPVQMASPGQACGLQGSRGVNCDFLADDDPGKGPGWPQSRQNWAPRAVAGAGARVGSVMTSSVWNWYNCIFFGWQLSLRRCCPRPLRPSSRPLLRRAHASSLPRRPLPPPYPPRPPRRPRSPHASPPSFLPLARPPTHPSLESPPPFRPCSTAPPRACARAHAHARARAHAHTLTHFRSRAHAATSELATQAQCRVVPAAFVKSAST